MITNNTQQLLTDRSSPLQIKPFSFAPEAVVSRFSDAVLVPKSSSWWSLTGWASEGLVPAASQDMSPRRCRRRPGPERPVLGQLWRPAAAGPALHTVSILHLDPSASLRPRPRPGLRSEGAAASSSAPPHVAPSLGKPRTGRHFLCLFSFFFAPKMGSYD